MASFHLSLFWEFLGKNDSTWDYWETSTLCQGTWHNTPAQLLRKASCQKRGFRKLKCWWTPKSTQGSPLSAVSCYARRDSCCKLQHSRGWHEQKGHHHSSPPREALSHGKAFIEKDIFITLSINNNKFQKQYKRHPLPKRLPLYCGRDVEDSESRALYCTGHFPNTTTLVTLPVNY